YSICIFSFIFTANTLFYSFSLHVALPIFAGFLLRSHVAVVPGLFPFALTAQIKPQESEGFSLQRVHDFCFLSIQAHPEWDELFLDRKSTRLNSSHQITSYDIFCLKKKKQH